MLQSFAVEVNLRIPNFLNPGRFTVHFLGLLLQVIIARTYVQHDSEPLKLIINNHSQFHKIYNAKSRFRKSKTFGQLYCP